MTSANGTTSRPGPPGQERSRVGRVLVTIAVVAMVGMWIYVLYLAFGPGTAKPPEELKDPRFAQTAQPICAATNELVAKLPPAFTSKTAADRSVVLAQANAYYAHMLDRLDAIAPTGVDATLADEWLHDWRTYLGDRQAYATALQTNPKARLLVSPRNGTQVTEYLDAFAGDNNMPACSTPGDVG